MIKPQLQVTRYIKKTGMPPYMLAKWAGIPNGTFYNWLNGKGDLKLSQWVELEKIVRRAA